MAPRECALPGTRTTKEGFVIEQSLAHPSTEEEAPPCVCIAGVAYIGHMVEDSETGDEVEVFEAMLCHRCADVAGGHREEDDA